MKSDCIAAIATPFGTAGIAIIRLSGSDSLGIVNDIFTANLLAAKSHTITYGRIKFGAEVIDECLVTYMAAPRTYTKEDVVEINCHGGIKVTQTVLEAVLAAGARLAEPGEFTKRAFLNGRIDLSQAEAVKDLINAATEHERKSALSQLRGSLSNEVNSIRDELLRLLAAIALAIDYPEHDEEELTNAQVLSSVLKIEERIKVLSESFDKGKILREGLATAIVGRPNVGKSSVLNSLLEEERAIVTDIAGTTRDILHEYINIAGIRLKISDTAGLRETDDAVEKIGVSKTKEYMNEAALIFAVIDASQPLAEEDKEILKSVEEKECIVLLNKADLPQLIKNEQLYDYAAKERIINFSAKSGKGLNELSDLVAALFFGGEIKYEQTLTNARHKDCLAAATENLNAVKDSVALGLSCDFISVDLQEAYENMSKIVGEAVEEDLIDKIFSDFCLGK